MKNSVIALFVLFTLVMPMMASEQSPQVERYPKKELRGEQRPRTMHRKDFKMMCDIVKDASFSDKKIGVIKVACISSYFDSKQCAKLLALFSFDNDKLEALKVLAPRIVDVNPKEILKQFTFSSNKDKALDILSER